MITAAKIELPTFYGNSDEIYGWLFDGFPLCDDAMLHYGFKGHARLMKAAIDGSDLSWTSNDTGIIHGDGVAEEYPRGLYCAHCGGELIEPRQNRNGYTPDLSDSEDNVALRALFTELHPLKFWWVCVENIGIVLGDCLYRAVAQRTFVTYTRNYPTAQCSFWESGVDDPIVVVEPRRR